LIAQFVIGHRAPVFVGRANQHGQHVGALRQARVRATFGDFGIQQPVGFFDALRHPSPGAQAHQSEQGRLAAHHAFGEPTAGLPELYPIGIYSIPEVSYVGATEVELTRNSVAYEVGVSRYRELARGQIAGDSYGMLKLLVPPTT
jgi:hypothetical protein